MYEKFFYLRENPFNITPDPKFLYLSKKHQEALDLLFFGISQRKGFLLLTGEVGTGKTTLCRALLDKLSMNLKTALIINPFLSDIELIQAMNEDFGLKVDSASLKDQLDALNSFLLEKAREGGNAVVIIDEAQNLSPKALEMVRLLSNLETEKMKLLQIVLIGQPELREKLRLPELRQLNQRIVVRYHLRSLNFEETKAYIFRRLTIAGGKGNIKFTSTALKSIYEASSGIPRLINLICDRSLTAAFIDGKRLIDEDIERKAVDELDKDGTLRKDIDIPVRRTWLSYRSLPYASVPVVIGIVVAGVWLGANSSSYIPESNVIPSLKVLSNSTTPQTPVIKNASAQPFMQKNIVAQESGNSANHRPLSKSSQSSGETHESVSMIKLTLFVNEGERVAENGETIEIDQGDTIKIADVALQGAESKDVSVNFLGFVGNRSGNDGEDRGYVIDTGKDLWTKYSIDNQGREYPIVVKYGDRKIGEVIVKLKEKG